MRQCKTCGLLPKNCKCTSKRDEITRCPRCSLMTRYKYMKNIGPDEICSNCAVIASYPLDEIDYYRELAEKYDLKLFDIGTHVWAANALNRQIDDYLAELPKTESEFEAYFAGTNKAEMAVVIWPGYK